MRLLGEWWVDRKKEYETYTTLQAQLVDAYTMSGSQSDLIERLTDEIATVRRRILSRRLERDASSSGGTTIPDILLE